jgi:hypothetical protein
MENTENHTSVAPPAKIHTAAYVLAGVSFIPLIGLIFGIAALVLSILGWRKRGAKIVALIASLGMLCTVALYGALFYFGFVQRGGVYDELRQQLTVNTLSSLVSEVEFYRLQHGVYPESLEQLQESQPNKPIFMYDTSTTPLSSEPLRLFYYERSGDTHYYLRSVGNDGEAFTADDILPNIEQTQNSKIGLLLQKEAQ